MIGGERLRADPMFDTHWYRWTNPDAPRSARGAARHFVVVGVDEFRSPSPDFSAVRYAAGHPDVADSGLSPLVHYVRFGRREGRTTWSHYERFFADENGHVDRAAFESFLRGRALTEGRGSVLRATPHLLHATPRGKARAFGDILVALAKDAPADLGPVLVTGPSRGSLEGVAVSILGEAGILATATLAALLVGAEVGREQIAEPGEPTPEGDVLVEVQAGALVLPGSIGWLALHARRGSGRVTGIALQADGAPAHSWTDEDSIPLAILTGARAEAKGTTDALPPLVVPGAAAVWWPQSAPPASTAHAPASQRRRALVMDASVPTTDLDSGSLCSVSYARTLVSLGYRVVFVPQDLRYHPRYTPELESWGVEVVDERYVGSIDDVIAGVSFELAVLIRASVFTLMIDRLHDAQPGVQVLFAPLDLGDHDESSIARAAATIVFLSTEVDSIRRLQPAARVAHVPAAHTGEAAASAAMAALLESLGTTPR